jgi:hypothetical protein
VRYGVNALNDPVRAKIVADSVELDRLNQAIRDTYARRGLSRHEHEEWSKACAKFHAEYANLSYPGGDERLEAFLRGDAAEIETAILFLDVDPYFFRSGYLKQIIWDRLKGFELSTSQRTQLELVAIAYLQKRIRLEFWHMARYVRRHGSDEFWQKVTDLSASSIPSIRLKANWVLLANENWPVRRWINREIFRARHREGYIPNLDFHVDENVARRTRWHRT